MAFSAAALIVNPYMSYIALARKWRPRTFAQLLGQDHVNKALIKSLDQQRLHHAYLFTGTRGVGKTSVARLFAKALNCEQGIGSTPCLQCDACVAIEQGRFIDLIEVDGASRTRVEDTRELLDNIHYAPTSARFKIYLIDEVHMLSQHSFNALLKTLEEPPAHVKFLLATTDPQKLPVTVLSRCLQFHLKPIQTADICHQLATILDEEQLPFDKPALDAIATAADGSMRDALSLLDQAIASCDKHVGYEAVKRMLGHTQQDYAIPLLQALADLEPHTLIKLSRAILLNGGQFSYVLDEMLRHLHQMTIYKTIHDHHGLIETVPRLPALTAFFSQEDLQLLYEIGLNGLENLSLAPTVAIGFEMTLLRMYTFKPAPIAPMPLYQGNPSANQPTPSSNNTNNASLTNADAPPVMRLAAAPTPYPTKQAPETNKPAINLNHDIDWPTLLPLLGLTGLALNAAQHAEWAGKTATDVALRLTEGYRSLFTPAVIVRIENALTTYFQTPLKLKLEASARVDASPAQQKQREQREQHDEAQTALQDDAFFQQLQTTFSATLLKDSVTMRLDKL